MLSKGIMVFKSLIDKFDRTLSQRSSNVCFGSLADVESVLSELSKFSHLATNRVE
jgi:hypothetical protein